MRNPVVIQGAPYSGEFSHKSLWKGGSGDDSPWDGEMSEGQRGQVPVRETFPQKGFHPIVCINFNISIEVTSCSIFYVSIVFKYSS